MIIRRLRFYLSLYFTANKADKCSFNNCSSSISAPGSRLNQHFTQSPLFLSTRLSEPAEIQLPSLTQSSKSHLEPESNRSTDSTKQSPICSYKHPHPPPPKATHGPSAVSASCLCTFVLARAEKIRLRKTKRPRLRAEGGLARVCIVTQRRRRD